MEPAQAPSARRLTQAAPGSLGARARPAAVRRLRGWPVYVLFAGFPLWWVLGLGALIWPIMAVPMLFALLLRGRLRAPRGFGLWLGFLAFMLLSAATLTVSTRVIAFTFRALLYLAATVVFLYVFNASRRDLPLRRLAAAVTVVWCLVVVGGYLGVLMPHGSISTPTERLMPQSLLSNDFVRDLVHPKFAQVNEQGRFSSRPQAPFTYANEWGSNFALLLPFVIIGMATARSNLPRMLLTLVLAASLVPAFLTLNRGLWVSLGFGLLYAAGRYALRGRVRAVMAVVLLLALAGVVATALPVSEELASGAKAESNRTRLSLYGETVSRTLQSPLVGYGAPQPSTTSQYSPDVGTQGQLWMVMYSHGIPATVLFVLWFVVAAWHSRRAVSGTELWAHVLLVVAIVQLPFYGMLPMELFIIMIAVALAHREAPALRRAETRKVEVSRSQ
jgi:polysaccharide biosynthesis protein PslJ